jgi:CRP/FNR family transcriptional regulator, anaerobic regulatory protein
MLLKSFKRMPIELEEILRSKVHRLAVRQYDIIQEPGAITDKLYFVEKGLFRMYDSPKGKKDTLRFKTEDEFIIALHALLPDNEDVEGIEALEDGVLWYIPGALVQDLRTKFIQFNIQCSTIMMKDCAHLKYAARCYASFDASNNYQSLCKHFPRLLHRVPISCLADYIRMPEEMFHHLHSNNISLNVSTPRRRRREKK